MSDTSLPQSGFLANASASLLSMLQDLSTDVVLSKGETLFELGDEGDALFAIVSGAVEFSTYSLDGRRLGLEIMREGELFGEISLFDPGERTANATALEPSRLLRVKNGDVLSAIQRQPELVIDMISLAGQRMRWMNRQLSEHVFLPMPVRLARKIMHLTRDDDADEPALSLSQAELAEFVGATREAVSKTISQWKKQDVIHASRGGLRVLDPVALEKIAEFDEI